MRTKQPAARSTGPRPLPNLDETPWTALNDFLRNATEAECRALLDAERSGQARPLTLSRITCRYIKMMGRRVRQEETSVSPRRR